MSPKAGAAATRAKGAAGRTKAAKPVAKRPTARAATPTRKRPAQAKAKIRTPAARTATPKRKTAAPKPGARKRPAVRKPASRTPNLRKLPVQPPRAPKSPKRVGRAASPRKRLVTLLVLMGLAFAVVVARLVDVQAIEGNHYEAMAEAQRVRSVSLAAERGSIFDRNGNDLALSVPQHTIYADPRVVKDPDRYARKLAPIVDVDRAKLRSRLAQAGLAFVYVARKVSDSTAARVKKLDLPGIGFYSESKRFYPGGALAGPVLGFVGTDNNGLGGLEAGYEKTLRGKPGKLVTEEDPNGREIPATQRTDDPARRGGDLVLTLDQSLQFEVEKQLTAQVDRTEARGGIAIVADVTTGDVLAMASVDGVEGDGDAEAAPATESNRPLTAVYEPGSTAKVISVGGALEAGVVEPTTSFVVPYRMHIADREFKDAEEHNDETWTVSDIVRESSNIGVIKIAEQLGKERLDQYQRAFGFGSKTAINFPAESAGLMKDVEDYVPSDMGSVPIGYTTAVTPMQMLDVFVTVANGGVSRPPRLVAAKIGADGTRRNLPPKRGHRVISEATAAELNTMLRGVVNDGTGLEAQISGYTVAGKTGTSRKPPYEPPRYMASFAGFAPAESPRLAAIVVIDQPGTNNNQYFGGKVAAPLFSTIMQYALRLERVPPTTAMSAESTTNGAAAYVSATRRSAPSNPQKSGARSPGVASAPISRVAAGILGRHVP